MSKPLSTSLLLLGAAAAGVALLPAESPQVQHLIPRYEADARSIERAWNLPWNAARSVREERVADDWLNQLDAMPFELMEHPEQVDWLLLRNYLQRQKAALARERTQLEEMAKLLPFREAIQQLELDRQQRKPADPEKAASVLAALVKPVQDLRGAIEKQKEQKDEAAKDPAPGDLPKVTPVLALRAAGAVESIRGTLGEWFRYHDGYQPEFGWWVREPHRRLNEALEAHARYLREEIAGQKGNAEDPLVGDPLGAAELAAEISAEMLPYTAEELIAIGEREFAWCEERMKEVATALNTDTAGVLEKVKSARVAPGSQDELVASEAERAIAFLLQHDLVTVPPLCLETWRMQMIPPETQKTLPYAVYSNPAMMIAYAAESMPHEDKLMSMRGNNRHFTRIVTPHELIPGHHLQKFAAARNRPWRRMFDTPFYVEGWALHWEMLFWDRGYAESPEDRAGMLFWRMHRCARIIVSLKFHLGQMTPAEMVDFLVQRVGHEKMGAASEVRRYIGGAYSPLYQAGYMLGGLQLRAMHRELTGPGKMTDRAFHDAVLEQNAMPIAMLRAALTKAPLTRTWKSTWRFADRKD